MASRVRPVSGSTRSSNSEMALSSLLSFGLVLGVLSRTRWGPLLEPYGAAPAAPAVVRQAALIYAAVSGVHAYVLWVLNRFLREAYEFHGADRAVLLAVALLGVDVVADVALTLSGAPGFQVYPIPLGFFGLILSYPHFAYFALGVAMIALGYSLLRAPENAYGLLRPYGQAQIVAGAALAAPPLAGLWPWPAAVGHVLLGLIFFQASTRQAGAVTRRMDR
ncbi:MAG: hypothetical protein ACHQ4J_06630 [Candidatus Binatia bacterium]